MICGPNRSNRYLFFALNDGDFPTVLAAFIKANASGAPHPVPVARQYVCVIRYLYLKQAICIRPAAAGSAVFSRG